MSEAKFTPGPWSVIDSNHEVVVRGPRFREIIAAMVHDNTAVGQTTEVRANARLISAAPELLEFAQSFIAWDTEGISPLAAQARAAIAKATGK